jgi:NADPH2:quinone reductase
MRTVVVSRFGAPDVLEPRRAAAPRPAPGQVVVEVEVVEVLFLDTQLRAGWGREFFPVRPPFVPGTGVGGTVVGMPGRRVVARTGNDGAYAERVVVAAEEAIDVPKGLDLAVALAALHDGVLALDRLDRSGLGPGSRVLVTAAAGSVGQWLVPLAAAAGAVVTGAAGGRAKVAAVRALGSAVSAVGPVDAVDYRRNGWVTRAGGPFDVVFDGAGGDVGRAALSRTVDGGVFHAYGAASGEFAAARGERGITVVGVEQAIGDVEWWRLVRRGLDLLAAGHVRPAVGQRLPLEAAALAHTRMERREVLGKTVLTL